MVKLNKIYTRTGDRGTTALGDGTRLPKHALRIEAYGSVDETNAALGLARLTADGELAAMLERIQNDLFDLGAELCVPEAAKPQEGAVRVVQSQVDRLEQEVDRMNARLEPLRSFVLPGGTASAAHLHLARTVARRTERLMVALAEGEAVGETALKYINRLSDHLFVAARFANSADEGDVLWVPGANR